MKKLHWIVASIFVTALAIYGVASAEGIGTIPQLQQFVSTTTPVSAITQQTWGKAFRLSGQADGCAQFGNSGVLTSTGIACGSGSGGSSFPFTSFPSYNATSTAIGFLNGLFSTASSTFNGMLNFANASGTQLTTTGSTYLATTGGKVGVGTTNPGFKMHIVGGDDNTLAIDNAGSTYTSVYWKNNGTNKVDLYWKNTDNSFNFQIPSGNAFHFIHSATDLMTILTSGDVGIGITSPTTKLDVVGGTKISGVLNLSGTNQIHQISGHNLLQGDATRTYFYGGTSGIQFRKSDNSTHLVELDDSGNWSLLSGSTMNTTATTLGINQTTFNVNGQVSLLGGIIHQIASHNFVQGDSTNTYLYGGTSGMHFRSADNSTALIDISNTGNLTFSTDNTQDIGASGATRPRNLYLGGTLTVGSTASMGSTVTYGASTNGGVIDWDASNWFITAKASKGLYLGANAVQGQMVINTSGSVGIATTSPYRVLSVQGDGVVTGNVRASSFTATSTVDFSTASVTQHTYGSFSYATSTAWTATTTIPLGTAYVAETWKGVQCFTDTGTLNVDFYHTSTHVALLNASTTVGTFGFSSNNTLTAGEKRYVDIGTPASSPTKISCTLDKIINR